MGWKWEFGDITAPVNDAVQAKVAELVDQLAALATGEQSQAATAKTPQKQDFHEGRASAFREVRDSVKPK